MISRFFKDHTHISTESDGLKLSGGRTFADDLQKFLTTKTPLKACRYCLGNVGRRFAQEQAAVERSTAPSPTDELIDRKYLKYYEIVGNRQVPFFLERIGKPARKVLFAIRNLSRYNL